MHRRMKVAKGWAGVFSRALSLAASVAMLSCSGADLTSGSGTSGAETGKDTSATPDFVAGVKLGVASITPTHSVEFWETEPGTVLMIQKWDSTQGEQPLELGPQFRKAGGSFGGLYRKLANDPNAALSPEMVAADKRVRETPIRDASLPRPPSATPPLPAVTVGQAVADAPAASTATPVPGTVTTQGVTHRGGGIDVAAPASYCSDPEVDGGWCPPGAYYSFATGNTQEVMFFDSIGNNPQAAGGSSDRYTLRRIWSNGTSRTDFSYGLAPGHSVGVTYVGTAATYQGGITGYTVAYAEKWRLSFPSLSYTYSAPAWGNSEGTFANDIEGIAHGNHISRTGGPLWFFSRTEFCGGLSATCNAGDSLHGQVAISGDLYAPSYECTFDGPWRWVSSGYKHFGDIVYEQPLPPLRSGYLIVSLNGADNKNGGVGFLGVVPSTSGCQEKYKMVDMGTVGLSASEQAPAVAMTHKYTSTEPLYSAHIYVPASYAWNALHEYLIDFSSTPTVIMQDLTTIVNASGQTSTEILSNPNGMKVSSHGKLYMWGVATASQTGRLYGIDPFSGFIQTTYDLDYGGSGFWVSSIESEGLDIIDTGDFGGAAPEILVQILANTVGSTSQWRGAHFSVDDPSRL